MLKITLRKKYYAKRINIGKESTLHFSPKFSDFSVAHIALLSSLVLTKAKKGYFPFELLQRSNSLLTYSLPALPQ